MGVGDGAKVLVIDDSNTIMLSSKDGLFDKARGRMVGSEDYLTKPFTKEQLLRAVDQYRRSTA